MSSYLQLSSLSTIMSTTPPPHCLRILVVDDDPICSKILHRAIALSPQHNNPTFFKIDILLSAEAALDELKKSKYDIIFTDIEMKGMTGDEMACQISDRTIPIYAITAKVADDNLLMRCKEAGIQQCLEKPAKPSIIHEIIGGRIEEIIENGNP